VRHEPPAIAGKNMQKCDALTRGVRQNRTYVLVLRSPIVIVDQFTSLVDDTSSPRRLRGWVCPARAWRPNSSGTTTSAALRAAIEGIIAPRRGAIKGATARLQCPTCRALPRLRLPGARPGHVTAHLRPAPAARARRPRRGLRLGWLRSAGVPLPSLPALRGRVDSPHGRRRRRGDHPPTRVDPDQVPRWHARFTRQPRAA
jgi:hypothetical protein